MYSVYTEKLEVRPCRTPKKDSMAGTVKAILKQAEPAVTKEEPTIRCPVAIEPGDSRHAWGVTVPDLPGCFSAGDTMEQALDQTRDAILLHVEGLLDEGQPVPGAQPIEHYRNKRAFKNRIWALIDVDLSQLKDVTKHCGKIQGRNGSPAAQ